MAWVDLGERSKELIKWFRTVVQLQIRLLIPRHYNITRVIVQRGIVSLTLDAKVLHVRVLLNVLSNHSLCQPHLSIINHLSL